MSDSAAARAKNYAAGKASPPPSQSAPPPPATEESAAPAARRGFDWRGFWARLRPLADLSFGIDLRALAVLRIGLGVILLCDLWDRARNIEAHYTSFGVTPPQAVYLYDGDRWSNLSPYMWVDGVPAVACLMILAAVLALLMLFGWKTRWTAIASYLMLVAIQDRNPMILTGADLLLRVLMFWALWTPLGARWSLDGVAAQWRRAGKTLPSRILSLGTAGLLLQIAAMYWFTAACKSSPEWRSQGTAVYYALSIGHYATPVGYWLRGATPLIKPMTWGTWWLEFLGPTLALLPLRGGKLRLAMCGVFIVFHLVLLNLCFDLGPFPYTATLAWIPFVPTFFWDWLEKRWNERPLRPIQAVARRLRSVLVAWQTKIVDRRVRANKPAPRLGLSAEMQGIAAFLIVYVLLWNLRGLDWSTRAAWIPEPLDFTARMLRLDQGWTMFAPKPMVDAGWFVMPAKLKGDPDLAFDEFTGHRPIDWSKPVRIYAMYPNERWRKYLMNLWVLSNLGQRPYFADWVCRHWNRDHQGIEQMDKFELVYMRSDTRLDRAESVPMKAILWQATCTGTTPMPQLPPGTPPPSRGPAGRKMQWP